MHKKNNFYIKLLTNVGNPDFKQDPSKPVWNTDEIKNVNHRKLSKLRNLVTLYIDENDLGGGNFIPPKVYKNNKYLGYFSFNGKFWREKYPFPELEKEFAI
tara:strand:- start:154 stop:456 length:303 start_codon:yes stop_codon:yes gene_type:complete